MNPFTAASEILKLAAVDEIRHTVLFYGKKLTFYVKFPTNSPWRCRFQEKCMAALFGDMSFKFSSDLDEEAWHWIKLAPSMGPVGTR